MADNCLQPSDQKGSTHPNPPPQQGLMQSQPSESSSTVISISRLVVKAASLEAETVRLRGSLLTTQADLDAARAGKLEIEKELGAQRSSGRQRLQAMQEEASRLQGQMEAVSSSLRDQQRMTDQYRGECEAVMAGREGAALSLAVELQQARSRLAVKEAECLAQLGKLDGQSVLVEALDSELAHLRKQLVDMRDAVKRYNEGVEHVSVWIKGHVTEAQGLVQQLGCAVERMQAAEEANAAAEDKVKGLEGSVMDLRGRLSAAEEVEGALRARLNEVDLDLSNGLVNRQALLSSLSKGEVLLVQALEQQRQQRFKIEAVQARALEQQTEAEARLVVMEKRLLASEARAIEAEARADAARIESEARADATRTEAQIVRKWIVPCLPSGIEEEAVSKDSLQSQLLYPIPQKAPYEDPGGLPLPQATESLAMLPVGKEEVLQGATIENQSPQTSVTSLKAGIPLISVALSAPLLGLNVPIALSGSYSLEPLHPLLTLPTQTSLIPVDGQVSTDQPSLYVSPKQTSIDSNKDSPAMTTNGQPSDLHSDLFLDQGASNGKCVTLLHQPSFLEPCKPVSSSSTLDPDCLVSPKPSSPVPSIKVRMHPVGKLDSLDCIGPVLGSPSSDLMIDHDADVGQPGSNKRRKLDDQLDPATCPQTLPTLPPVTFSDPVRITTSCLLDPVTPTILGHAAGLEVMGSEGPRGCTTDVANTADNKMCSNCIGDNATLSDSNIAKGQAIDEVQLQVASGVILERCLQPNITSAAISTSSGSSEVCPPASGLGLRGFLNSALGGLFSSFDESPGELE